MWRGRCFLGKLSAGANDRGKPLSLVPKYLSKAQFDDPKSKQCFVPPPPPDDATVSTKQEDAPSPSMAFSFGADRSPKRASRDRSKRASRDDK